MNRCKDMENPDSCDVKQEYAFCFGCLSADRNLMPLGDRAELFVYLLGEQDGTNVTEYMVCWECVAMLNKIVKFQFRVRFAQTLLQKYLDQEVHTETLSTLKSLNVEHSHFYFDHLEDTAHDTDLDNQPVFSETYSSNLVKKETLGSKEKKQLENIAVSDLICMEYENKQLEDMIKSENEDYFDTTDNCYTDNIDTSEVNMEENDSIVAKKKKQVVRQKRRREYKSHGRFNKWLRHLGKITKKLDIDLKKYRDYFQVVLLSDSDMQNIGNVISSESDCSIKTLCKMCNKYFHTRIDLNRHKTFVHILNEETQGPSNCLSCKAYCKNNSELRSHWLSAHATVQQCNVCQTYVAQQCSCMKEHLKQHLLIVSCNECPMILESKKELKEHFIKYHSIAICNYCNKQFKNKYQVEKHIRNNHKPVKCKYCNKAFTSTMYLRRHLDRLTCRDNRGKIRSELAYCVECDKQYNSIERYKSHLHNSVVHNPNIKQRVVKIIPCPDCGKEFRRATYMKNHYNLLHKKQTKYYCQPCDKYMGTAWSMKMHNQGVHQKIRLPKTKVCEECGRPFSTTTLLKKHMLTHTGERPFKCAHCDAAFTQKHPLKSHMKTKHNMHLE